MILPPVAVIIPVYNGEADLPNLVDCLLCQTYPAELVEYLLVDNNSGDRTAKLIQEAEEKAKFQGITLRYLSEDQIQSSYAARNKGIQATKAEILAFTDADCRPQPDWLMKLIPPFAKPEIGLVVGEILALPGNTLLEKHAEGQGILSQKNTLAHSFCPYGQTANLAVRRKAFAEVGLFRPYLTTGGDADMCWRIQKEAFWQLHFAEDGIIRHRHRETIKELASQWRRYGRSNLYLNQLHGIPLRPKVEKKYYLFLLTRWLLKELPLNVVKALLGKTNYINAIATPINVFCIKARDEGQAQASLPEEAKQIPSYFDRVTGGSNK
ncbi:MAG: glycosyltransferase [Spirulinaceae cyanobacterium]